ncbi:MAG: hypothetical protein MJ073_06070 [Oscillibacter sp.]|nr:hypothetical protein [Oscillibacter sp.]
MPKLTQEQLKWFFNFQTVLKETYKIHPSNPRDIGRVKLVDFQDEKTGAAISTGTVLEDIDYTAKVSCAFQLKPTHPYAEADERAEAQEGFYVDQLPNGEYEMDSRLSDDALLNIYEHAKNGKLFINSVGGSIVHSEDNASSYVLVGKDGSALPTIPSYGKVQDINIDNLQVFYDKHPELLDVPLSDKALRKQTFYEAGPVSQVENATDVIRNMEISNQAIANTVTELSKNPEAREIAIEYNYDIYCWKHLHTNMYSHDTLGKTDWIALNKEMKEELASMGAAFDVDNPAAYDRLFCYSGNPASMRSIREAAPKAKFSSEGTRNLADYTLEHLRNGTLYTVTSENGTPELSSVSKTRNGVRVTPVAQEPAPARPNFFKRILHGMNKNWFKAEFDRYETQMARHSAVSAAAKTLPAKVGALLREEEAREEAQAAPKPCTKEEFSNKLAAGILNAQRSANGRSLLSTKNLTPDDIKNSPSFNAFLETPEMKQTAEKAMAGEEVSMSAMGSKYMNFMAQKQAAPESKEPVASATKVLEQNQPQLNVPGAK